MAFKLRKNYINNKPSSNKVAVGGNKEDREAYRQEMIDTGRKSFVIKGSPIGTARMQMKWWKYGASMGSGPGPKRTSPENLSPEQRAQKHISDELYLRASKMVQPKATTAGISAQGPDFEKVYHSPQFQQFLRKTHAGMVEQGHDPNMVTWDLAKGWDYGPDGTILTGERLSNKYGVSHERLAYHKGENFRDQSKTESEQFETKAGYDYEASQKDQWDKYKHMLNSGDQSQIENYLANEENYTD